MSNTASRWAWSQSLKCGEKTVLVALADYANQKNQCWPSIEALAEKCGLGRSAVFGHIKKLVGKGYVIEMQRWKDCGGQATSMFTLLVPCKCPKSGGGGVQNLDEGGPESGGGGSRIWTRLYRGTINRTINRTINSGESL